MAIPNSRQEFKEYIMRKLGHPVIQINVADEQVEDRIDEALAFFSDFHYNGSEHIYVKHLVTEADLTRGYIEMPDNMLGVTRIFPIGNSISMGGGMWNVQYQYVLNNMSELTSGSISNYWMTMQNIAFVQEWLVGNSLIRYNKHSNRLYVDDKDIIADQWIIIEGYVVLDPEFERVWSDRWFQNYAAVLVKEQWGANLGKFQNVQLMAGVTFNGGEIWDQARTDRKEMEAEAINTLQPLGNVGFIG